MLTAEDKDEIRRLITETFAESGLRFAEGRLTNEIAVVNVTARAIEVFGTRERALRWLETPVRALHDRTPLSLLNTAEGIGQVQDVLGRVEHGVW